MLSYDCQTSLPLPKYLTSDDPLAPMNNVEDDTYANKLVRKISDREPQRVSTLY